MNHNDPPHPRGIHDVEHAEAERVRDERIRDPYEARRPVRTFDDNDANAAAHPWDAAHGAPNPPAHGDRAQHGAGSHWSEQPMRYGGGYRGDDPHAAEHRAASEHRGPRHTLEEEQSDLCGRGQSNSGYDTLDADEERVRRRADHSNGAVAPADRAIGPRLRRSGDGPGRGHIGAQDGRQDTYGSEGYRQEGKRYGFDTAGDERGRAPSFRGVRPRNYMRSDERLRELINEQLTDADLDASDIEVKVSEGTVTLEGTVSQRWMKHQAEDLVDECSGVTDIHNHLRIRQQSTPPGPPSAAAATPGNNAAVRDADTADRPQDRARPPGSPTSETSRKH